MSTYIDLEIIQSFPFSNSNRDDAGQPKTVIVGGTTRGRISSQSLKRAARFYGVDKSSGYGFTGDRQGASFYRTRYAKNLILAEIKKLDPSTDYEKEVNKLFGDKKLLGKLAKDDKKADSTEKGNVLIVLTKEEIRRIAEAVITNAFDSENSEKLLEKILNESSKKDLALWGRFFASSSNATLDGAAQVAHAFTTHSVNLEDDFFVGLDDAAPLFSDHGGAGHPGDNFYITGTFYKYANVNLDEAIFNLLNVTMVGAKIEKVEIPEEELNTLVKTVIEKFLTSFILSVPQGKINSTAHQSLPKYVRVTIRKDRPANSGAAFDKAISDRGNVDIAKESVNRLEEEHVMIAKFLEEPIATYIFDTTNIAKQNLVNNLPELIASATNHLPPVVSSIVTLLKAEEEQ